MNLPQIAVNTLVFGAELGVIALGLSLSYAVLRFANFAHTEFVTVGAYLALVASRAGLPLIAVVPLAMVGTGLFAIAIDRSVFRHMREASAGSKMIASVAVALAIRAVIQILFGADAYDLPSPRGSLPPLGGARATLLQGLILVTTVVAMVLLHLLLRRTRVGQSLRACADNFPLALARGVPGERMISLTWFLTGAFAAMGGILIAMETQLRPLLGGSMVMQTFASASVGGLGSPYGAVGGALILSGAQNLVLGVDYGSLLGLGEFRLSVNYKDAIALIALIAVLLWRPQGLFPSGSTRR